MTSDCIPHQVRAGDVASALGEHALASDAFLKALDRASPTETEQVSATDDH